MMHHHDANITSVLHPQRRDDPYFKSPPRSSGQEHQEREREWLRIALSDWTCIKRRWPADGESSISNVSGTNKLPIYNHEGTDATE